MLRCGQSVGLCILVVGALAAAVPADAGVIILGPEELVEADGVPIDVSGYSVPSLACWDEDTLPDLIVGEGAGYGDAKVRVYLNEGTDGSPAFTDWFYAQTVSGDLACPASGCLGIFPRLVDWGGGSGVKNLLAGRADGKVELFLNVGSAAEPLFDEGTLIQVGSAGEKVNIDVGSRATPTVVDWDNDGVRDLVAGALDGRIFVFINAGTDAAPDFKAATCVPGEEGDLSVPSYRASPVVGDFNFDGKKDLLAGNTNGQLLLFTNVGTDAEPAFAGYVGMEADGVPIDLAGTPRSRPSVCYWDDDLLRDVLIGAGDGLVRLYLGVAPTGDLNCDGRVDFDDIDYFVQALYGIEAWPYDNCVWLNADCDGDGQVTFDDIDPFVALLGS